MSPKWIPLVLVVIAGFGGFSAGRWLATPQVKIETKTEEKVVYRDKIVDRIVEVKAATKTEIRVVTRTIWATPDAGTVTQEREVSGSKETLASTLATERIEAIQRDEVKNSFTVSTPVLKDWRVAVLVGASIREPLLPIAGPLVFGAEIDRRIIGPFWAGAWLNTGGSAGLSVAAEF
jgi:hypothetical protein